MYTKDTLHFSYDQKRQLKNLKLITWRIAVKEQTILSSDKKLYASKAFRRHIWSLVTVAEILVIKKNGWH